MLILGIESSCDETAASVVDASLRVRSSVIASQDDLHEAYAGVVPEIASRAHVGRITPVVRTAMREAGVVGGDIGAVAVGNRPGLIGSLLVGVAAAKAYAWAWGVPIVGVDHIRAHLTAALLDGEEGASEASIRALLPAIGLVVSGGHTAMYAIESAVGARLLGSTIDDAVGEAFDKAAVMLGLGYPGGAALDRLAEDGDDGAHDFPVSRLGRTSLDFSFSGLKTAMLYAIRGTPEAGEDGKPVFARTLADHDDRARADLGASFRRAAVGALMLKLERAIEASGDGVRTLMVGGGVSANRLLRDEVRALAARRGLGLRIPPMGYCTDNAAMIAGHAQLLVRSGHADDWSLAAMPTGASLEGVV